MFPFSLPCKQLSLNSSGSKRERDWCHKQSPDGITHTELLYWNSAGFARLETEPIWSSLLLRFPMRSHFQSLGAWNLLGVAFSRTHWLLHQRYWSSWGQAISTKLCLKGNLPTALQKSHCWKIQTETSNCKESCFLFVLIPIPWRLRKQIIVLLFATSPLNTCCLLKSFLWESIKLNKHWACKSFWSGHVFLHLR